MSFKQSSIPFVESETPEQRPVVDRLFEIEFLDRGAEAFAVTFG